MSFLSEGLTAEGKSIRPPELQAHGRTTRSRQPREEGIGGLSLPRALLCGEIIQLTTRGNGFKCVLL